MCDFRQLFGSLMLGFFLTISLTEGWANLYLSGIDGTCFMVICGGVGVEDLLEGVSGLLF